MSALAEKARMAETMATVAECDRWIEECRRRGEEERAQLGVARRAKLARGR